MVIGVGFDRWRVAPPPAREVLAVVAALLRVAAGLLLLLALPILVLVLVVAGLALTRLRLTGLALPRLTLTRLTLALASLLHGAHRGYSFLPALSRRPSRPPQRARDLRRFGIRAPDPRDSPSAMATACFRFRTFPPEPERSVRRLYSRITLLILARPFLGARRFAITASPSSSARTAARSGYLLAERTVSSFLTDFTPETMRACSEALA